MLFGTIFRHQQYAEQIDGAVVDCVEVYWSGQCHQQCHSVLAIWKTTVGNRNAITDAGAAKALAVEQAAEDLFGGGSTGLASEGVAGQFQSSFLTDDIGVTESARFGQKFGQVHYV
ncbi:hypothetical protein GCM10011352_06850 [Marinobacterium zhoushanense]|uniref:Uncharacterized protein n=1 Tax=Marinobacterium zhoushanense TaxID=1679163 RepID=A0ABQ1JZT4_9GAMM|nr:hypothetical protein GCM10011352_06850 [Marinobacterium zhoushanense]